MSRHCAALENVGLLDEKLQNRELKTKGSQEAAAWGSGKQHFVMQESSAFMLGSRI